VPNIVRRAIRRRRFGARARGPSSQWSGPQDCFSRATSASARVYIVDGTREILTSIVLRPRAETGMKMSSGEHSAAVQRHVIDELFARSI